MNLDRVLGLIEDAVEKGARRITAITEEPSRAALLVPPTLLLDVPAEAQIERKEVFGPARTDLDETLAQAFTTGWALHELPRRHVPRTDTETLQTAADLAGRLLGRGAVATCERHQGGRPLEPGDIAIGVAHRDQADLVRTALARTGNPNAPGVAVDTANRLQGREFEVVIVVHPLSGRRDATAFHLKPDDCVSSPPATGRHASSSPARESPTSWTAIPRPTPCICPCPPNSPTAGKPTRSCWPSSHCIASPRDFGTGTLPADGRNDTTIALTAGVVLPEPGRG